MQTLRQSALRAWLECPARFYAEYILGLEGEPSPHLAYGTAYHEAAENYHRGQKYNTAIMEGYPFAPDFFDPQNVELRFYLDAVHPFTKQKLDIPISGMIDAVNDQGIFDHKTSLKPYNQRKIDTVLFAPTYYGVDTTGLQATYYCYAYWLMTGRIVPFTFVVRRKNPGPRTQKFQVLTTTRTLEDFALLWELCERVLDDISWETDFRCTCFNRIHEEITT